MQQGNYLFILEIDFGSFLSSALLQLSLDGKRGKKKKKKNSWCLKIALDEKHQGGQGENQELVDTL